MTITLANYATPGVFINETLQPLATPSVAPQTDSIACFVGMSVQGPTVPMLVTSWSQFQRLYGSIQSVPPMQYNLTGAISLGSMAYLPYAVYSFFNNGGGACYILRIVPPDAAPATGILTDINSTPHNALNVSANSAGAWGNNLWIEIVPTANTTSRFTMNVRSGTLTGVSNPIIETFTDMSTNPQDGRYVVSIVNSPTAGSAYITLVDDKVSVPGWVYNGSVDALGPQVVQLASGANGINLSGINVANFTTSPPPAQPPAVQQLASLATGSNLLVNVPGVNDNATLGTPITLPSTAPVNGLIPWAQSVGTVMVVVDAPWYDATQSANTPSAVATNWVTWATSIGQTSHIAAYGPWLNISDPASSVAGAVKVIPPSGAVLGQYATSDLATGPHQTPAGTSTAMTGVLSCQYLFGGAQTDQLNTAGVNLIRPVAGYGICIMGGRTMRTGFPDRYISVRRTLMMIRRNLTAICEPALFAPNGPNLWLSISAQATSYLTQLMQSGALAGNTQATAFYVVCDQTNNTSSSAQAGQVSLQVGVALLSPAEFIVINISQFNGTTTVTDTSGT